MGMFDDLVPFTDHYQEGQEFTLEAAQMGPTIATEYGPSAPVLLRIEGNWYSIFGEGIANQVARMEARDLPALVKVERQPTKSGQEVKLLTLVGEPAAQADAA